jgi:hypothetical protein
MTLHVRPVLVLIVLLLPGGCGRADLDPPSAARDVVAKRLSFSVLEDYDKGDDLTRIEEDFRVLVDLGVREWRGSFGWDDYEPQAGRYDLEWLAEFVRTAQRAGIRLRPYLGYTPAWAARGGVDSQVWNDPPRDPARWEAFVSALATAFRDAPNLLSYEIYNEENAAVWWEGTSAEYADVLARASAAIRRADPDAQVILGGFTFPDTQWLEAICEVHGQARAFDVAAFHAYPETWTPENVILESYLDDAYREEFVGTLAGGCAGQPLWINEAGYATTPGRTEQQQASWWARAIATFAADSAVSHVGIYEIRDLPADREVIGDEPNHHLGLLHTDGRPKMAYRTVQLLVRLLARGPFVVRDRGVLVRVTGATDGAQVHHHAFELEDGSQLLVIWSRGGRTQVEVRLPAAGARAVSYTLAGAQSEYPLSQGRRLERVTLGPGDVRIFVIERE